MKNGEVATSNDTREDRNVEIEVKICFLSSRSGESSIHSTGRYGRNTQHECLGFHIRSVIARSRSIVHG